MEDYLHPFGPGRWRNSQDVCDYLDYMTDIWAIFDYDLDDEVPMEVDIVHDEMESCILKVKKVDLDIRRNTLEHHTDTFDITDKLAYDTREDLVLRRGQTFSMTITFNREYNEKEDDLRLIFQFGKRPNETKGTYVEFILSEPDNPNEWGAYIQSKDGPSVNFTFMTPPTCAVGKWFLQIGVVKPGDTEDTKPKLLRYKHKDPIYILFNPWCKDDQVYMKDEKNLNEYVLNATGRIYKSRFHFVNWKFGQFSGNVLDCVMYLLDKQFRDKLPDHLRGDPVLVSRALSSLVNNADNSGVLVGNWSGKYDDGVPPSKWAGSAKILEQYYKNKCPVKFGQCWVFSGVLTTVCRALGIPARSVTNIGSAHDTDESVTIDTYLDHNGEEIDYMNSDSVWNFHVWNDAWMARPKLPSGFGGWQAIDSTPQEASGGIYRMGPMPVLAIKRGDLNVNYDGLFCFAEVNADRVWWVRDEKTHRMSIKHVSTNSVGSCVVTKLPNLKETEYITDQYKYKEGTDEERAAVRNANIHSKFRKHHDVVYAKVPKEDLIDFKLEFGEVSVGLPITLTLKVTNLSNKEKTISGTLKLCSMYYTGIPHKEIAIEKVKDMTLKAKEVKYFSMDVPVDDYWKKTMDDCVFRIACMLMVKQTNQTFIEQKEIKMDKPNLEIQAPDAGSIGKKFEVTVSFINPLPMELTDCQLIVEGPGLQEQAAYEQPSSTPAMLSSLRYIEHTWGDEACKYYQRFNRDMKPNQTFSGKFSMTPIKTSENEIIVSFYCKQLCSIENSHTIQMSK